MSEGKKKALEGLDPNATIQIDQIGGLDQVELLDEPAPPAPAPPGDRHGPPALPSAAPVAPSAGVGRPGSGRTIARAVLVCAIVLAAMAAGLLVGSRVRGGASAAPAASGAPPAPPAAASASTLVLPTVELGRH
jgi:hypothetical protein